LNPDSEDHLRKAMDDIKDQIKEGKYVYINQGVHDLYISGLKRV